MKTALLIIGGILFLGMLAVIAIAAACFISLGM